ncbi:uncharacterized protein LOC121299684 [Polyodon spathula]|uniref:uncharacterized protein LOC121299684 n=1 Tax=Polyodon spathula TaxID=7913 RepID=UPI001B7F3BC1|nr:uncharacterized protein LOC121299684 [Polyodon spathula]
MALQAYRAATSELQRRRTTQLQATYRQARRCPATLQGSLCADNAVTRDQFVQDTAMLRECAEARKAANYNRRGFTERHTSGAIVECLHGIIQELDLTGKVQCAVIGNGAKKPAALTSLGAGCLPVIFFNDWIAIEQTTKILKPFAVTEEMSAEKYVTASKVVVLVRNLQKITATAAQQHDKVTTPHSLADALNKCLWKRFLGISTVLDPLFKTLVFGNDKNADESIKAVTAEASQLPEVSGTQAVVTGACSTLPDDVWKDFDAKVTQQNPNRDITAEVKMYLTLPLKKRCPLGF